MNKAEARAGLIPNINGMFASGAVRECDRFLMGSTDLP